MIKAVIFDLGGVYFTDGTKIAIEKISKRYKLPKESVQSFLGAGTELGNALRRGNIKVKEFWKKFKHMLNVKANDKELSKMFIVYFKPIKATSNIINKLRKKGIKVYFLSDSFRERVNYLKRRYGFLNDFDGGVFSYELNKLKFDGEGIFRATLEKTKHNPNEVIFIDDKENYVETAKKLGMKGIVFKNPKQLENELKKSGLL